MRRRGKKVCRLADEGIKEIIMRAMGVVRGDGAD